MPTTRASPRTAPQRTNRIRRVPGDMVLTCSPASTNILEYSLECGEGPMNVVDCSHPHNGLSSPQWSDRRCLTTTHNNPLPEGCGVGSRMTPGSGSSTSTGTPHEGINHTPAAVGVTSRGPYHAAHGSSGSQPRGNST